MHCYVLRAHTNLPSNENANGGSGLEQLYNRPLRTQSGCESSWDRAHQNTEPEQMITNRWSKLLFPVSLLEFTPWVGATSRCADQRSTSSVYCLHPGVCVEQDMCASGLWADPDDSLIIPDMRWIASSYKRQRKPIGRQKVNFTRNKKK